MRAPPWIRWSVAVIAVLAVAGAGVAANLVVLDSGGDNTTIGTLSARLIARTAPTPVPAPAPKADAAGQADRAGAGTGVRGDNHRDDDD